MKKERKKPPVQTITHHKFINGTYGGKLLTKEERDEILYPLGEFEVRGKGLPEEIPKEGDHPSLDLSFDIRISHDKEGNIELSYAWKNSDKHTILPFKVSTEKESCKASGDLQKNIQRAIENTCFMLATACVENQLKSFEDKRKLHNEILESISYRYKPLLGLGHYKTIEVTEKDGIKTEKSVFIDYGAKPQTSEEKEKEKQDFLDDLYLAFLKIKTKQIQKPKQKDLMPYMFKMHSDKQKKISETFKKHNLAFKAVLRIFNATSNYDDFINNAIRTKKITSK